MNKYLPYDPGVLPSLPPPSAGDEIALRVEGLPPHKDVHFSIRNPRHRNHKRFMALRQAAIGEMAGRAPYRGAVRLDFIMHAPEFETGRTLLDYVAGIMDTLDGSHGTEFTYLPIVYEDDCQVVTGRSKLLRDKAPWYQVKIVFLVEDGGTSSF